MGLNEQIRFRKANAQDALIPKRLGWLQKLDYKAHEHFVGAIEQQLHDPRSVTVFVAHKGNNVPVGLVIARNLGGFQSALEKFFVHPDERGTGIGKALAERGLRHVLSSFKSKHVYADVLLPEKRLYNPLYELGFRETGRTEEDRIKMALEVVRASRSKPKVQP